MVANELHLLLTGIDAVHFSTKFFELSGVFSESCVIFSGTVTSFRNSSHLDTECVCFTLIFTIWLLKLLSVVVFNSKLLESDSLLLVDFLERIVLLFSLTNSCEEVSVGLLLRHELLDHLLDIRVAGACSDLMEGLLDGLVLDHLFVHALLEESCPCFLDE